MKEAFYCARRRGRNEVRPQRDIADGARHPRVIWAVGESERGQARNRLTGIRTRGSPGPYEVALVIWGIDVFVSRRSWLSPGASPHADMSLILLKNRSIKFRARYRWRLALSATNFGG